MGNCVLQERSALLFAGGKYRASDRLLLNPAVPPNKWEPPSRGVPTRTLLIILVACAALTATAYYIGRASAPPIEYRIICVTGDEVREAYVYHHPPSWITDQEVAAMCKDEEP